MYDYGEKILLGNSIPLPEVDVDENKSDELAPEEALRGYWYETILSKIGKKDFKANYLTVIDDIKNNSPIDEQKRFCFAILEKIIYVYEYEFPLNLDFDNLNQIYSLYEFLEFLEYDNEQFICNVWKFLNFTNSTYDTIENFCINNINKIVKEIEEQINLGFYPEKISGFLRTYNKERLIEWFCRESCKVESQIKLNYLEGEEDE